MSNKGQDKPKTGKLRFSVITLMFAGVIALAAVVGTSVLMVSAERTDGSTAAVTNNERVVIAIEGMHCTACASGIKAMLKRTPGVVSAEVSFENKEARVEFNPADTSREKIVEVITNLGYKASVKG